MLPGIRDWSVKELRAAVSSVTSFRPDAVHFQFPARGYGRLQWVLPGILRAKGFKVFLTLHEYYEVRDAESFLAATLFFPNILSASGISVTTADHLDSVPQIYRWILGVKPVRHIPIGSNIHTCGLSEEDRCSVRSSYGIVDAREAMISYFGFVSPNKGVEAIFDVADPKEHRVILACELSNADACHRAIAERIATPPWKGRAMVTGFLRSEEVGRLLDSSDAVVFPFRNGVRVGHGSLEAALAQGTFTLTTSRRRNGYDPGENIYYARPGDIPEMSRALKSHLGTRVRVSPDHSWRKWRRIAKQHLELYSSVLPDMGRGK
ncbi:MAG: hypothetical protein C4529_01165 [Deltaproteobacteria bacterium]|nr:MAG: hypothetical protein C4529_01165 [Deltaproteobacteria bacterium]